MANELTDAAIREVVARYGGLGCASGHGGATSYNPSKELFAAAREFHRLGVEQERARCADDTRRLDWVMPLLDQEGSEGDTRALQLAAQLMRGLTGRTAIDTAIERGQ